MVEALAAGNIAPVLGRSSRPRHTSAFRSRGTRPLPLVSCTRYGWLRTRMFLKIQACMCPSSNLCNTSQPTYSAQPKTCKHLNLASTLCERRSTTCPALRQAFAADLRAKRNSRPCVVRSSGTRSCSCIRTARAEASGDTQPMLPSSATVTMTTQARAYQVYAEKLEPQSRARRCAY